MRHWLGSLPTISYPGSGLATSTRGGIVAAVLAELTNLSWANTVSHHRDRDAEPFDATELPAVLLEDLDGAVSEETIGYYDHRLRTTVTVVCASATPAETVREYAKEVMDACGTDPTWGNLAVWTYPGTVGIAARTADDELAAAVIDLEIHYRTARFGM